MRYFALFTLVFAFLSSSAWADPCGMVPPVYTGPGVPIKRVGPQKTYVFYKKGVESIVLRPAFSGKVDNFGMLIPFPTPPAIRKVSDNIFSHVAAAIDPPEVRVYVRRYRRKYKRRPRRSGKMKTLSLADSVSKEQVKVLRKEAVGMYQVAVLEAGSPKALKRWMSSHGYVYPKGMDKVVLEYIQSRWVFVAVKTRVSGKKGVKPRPGMRKAKPSFPKGGSFRGAVQAMGFRFKSKKLVIPMRLSAFNAGRLRNVVYILSDGPKRIQHINKKYVRRQLSGTELYRNVTSLLPLRVIGGKPSQIRDYRWRYIQRRRNPEPHNGLAKVLFASDLLAVKQGKLALPHEEEKKVLLRIGERLGLRGQALDRMHRKALEAHRQNTVELALKDLKRMTMTVVDGDFPRQVIARENLSFASFAMAANQNKDRLYNARMLRAMSKWQYSRGTKTWWKGPRKWWPKKKKKLMPIAKSKPKKATMAQRKQIVRLLRQFNDANKVNRAIQKLVGMGRVTVPYLWAELIENQPFPRRGWAVVTLAELGGARLGGRFARIHNNSRNPMLVRTWAAAARIKIAKTMGELKGLVNLINSYPPVKRPFSKKLLAYVNSKKGISVSTLLSMSTRYYALRRALVPAILSKGHKPLLKLMITAKNNRIRRQAAAYLGTLGSLDFKTVSSAVINAYKFKVKAKKAPWSGGALFIPSLRWTKSTGKQLVDNLIRWHIWAERHNKSGLQKQIHNNIRSLSLARKVGYRSPGWRMANLDRWLVIWGRIVGCDGIKAMLKQQGVLYLRRYQSVLGQMACP